MSSPSLARRVVLLAIWLVFVVTLAEGAVRLAGWMLRRDQALAPPPLRAGTDVVYCIGDSFTYGQGVRPDEAWPRVLAGLLEAQTPGNIATVRTLAEPGRSSSVAMLEVAKALKAGDARLVLVMTGWNANDGDFAAYAAANDRAIPWTVRLDLWLSHLRLYRVAKQALTLRSRTLVLDEVEVVPQTTAMQLYDFRAYQEIARDNLRRIAAMCHASETPCAFVTYPHQELPPNPNTKIEYYHALFGRTPIGEDDYLVGARQPGEIAIDAVIRVVGASENIPVIDTQPPFAAALAAGTKGSELFLSDWHHPTPKGHRMIAETVAKALAVKPPP